MKERERGEEAKRQMCEPHTMLVHSPVPREARQSGAREKAGAENPARVSHV